MSLAQGSEPTPMRPMQDAWDRSTELRVRIVALETALATSERVLEPSLLDFLA